MVEELENKYDRFKREFDIDIELIESAALAGESGTISLVNYYNKTEMDGLLASKEDVLNLSNYYNKTQVDSALVNKADANSLNNYILSSQKGVSGGIAPLDNFGKISSDKLADNPSNTKYLRGDQTWQVLDKTIVGLSNVDNTSDASKPISTSTQTALDTKVAKGSQVFSVKDYGAVGDGSTDDIVAINAAISAAQTAGGGIVYFPPGTYIIGTWSGTSGTNQHRAITLLPGVSLRGAGRGVSIIKVAASVGNYFTMAGPATTSIDLSGIHIEELTFDGNNNNNTVASPTTMATDNNYRAAIVVYTGSRVTIRNCRFTNMNAIWTTTINGTGTDHRIEGNLYDNYGNSSARHDSSTIFISGSRSHVTKNVFVGGGNLASFTAIEMHGDNQVITGNIIAGFFRGANLCGGQSTVSTTGVIFSNNEIRGCSVGLELWSTQKTGNSTGIALQDCIIAQNQIEIDYDAWATVYAYARAGIMLNSSGNYGIGNLSIQDNQIRYLSFTTTPVSGDLASSGISYYRATTVSGIVDNTIKIMHNKITGSPGPGIYLQPKSIIKRLNIEKNTIVNPATNAATNPNSAYRVGVKLEAVQDSFADVTINDNSIIDDRGTAVITAGVDLVNCSVAITNGEAQNNILHVSDSSASIATYKASATTSAAMYVRHRAFKYVGVINPTLYGSQIIDPTNGVIYTQQAFPYGTTWSPGQANPVIPGMRLTSGYYIGPAGTRSTVAMVANTEYAVPIYISGTGSISTMGIEVTAAGTAGTLIRLGLRGDNGTGQPGTLILDAGTLAGDAITASGIEITGLSQSLTPGLYWFTATAQSTGGTLPTLRAQTGDMVPVAAPTLASSIGSASSTGYVTGATVTGALPSTYTVSTRTFTPPRVVAKCT